MEIYGIHIRYIDGGFIFRYCCMYGRVWKSIWFLTYKGARKRDLKVSCFSFLSVFQRLFGGTEVPEGCLIKLWAPSHVGTPTANFSFGKDEQNTVLEAIASPQASNHH